MKKKKRRRHATMGYVHFFLSFFLFCKAEGCASMYESLEKSCICGPASVDTVCDGIAVKVRKKKKKNKP